MNSKIESNTCNPVFWDDNAIQFLRNEFGEKYNDFYQKFIKRKNKHFMGFYHYKNYAIINMMLIYDYNDYIKFLKNFNMNIKEFFL
jgi:hypothetical protein